MLNNYSKMPKELHIYTCTRCGYKWAGRPNKPKTCANKKCKSKYWDKERTKIWKQLKRL